MTIMTNQQFANKAKEIATKYRTSYMLGAFGFRATEVNIQRLLNQYPENYNWVTKARQADWLFDCSHLIAAILWGWNGDSSQTYGGAKYCSYGLNDVNDEGLKAMCSGVNNNFSNIKVGELLFAPGHVGCYIGNGMAVEATPSWSCSVQITDVSNIGSIAGLNIRMWQSHGKLDKFISYTSSNSSVTTPPSQINYKQAIPARYFSKGYAKEYTVMPQIGVNIRTQPTTKGDIIKAIPKGSKVNNYGYYGMDEKGDVWLYIKCGNIIGYIKKKFLI